MHRHIPNTRYAFDGSSEDCAVGVSSYSLVRSSGDPHTIEPILTYSEWESNCGWENIGYFEKSHSGDLFLPTFFTKGTDETPHRLMVAKKACIEGNISYEDYVEQVVRSMRGKNGCVRTMNSMVVQGSTRMVISPWHVTNAGEISIPAYVANHTRALECIDGIYRESSIRDGDHCIVIRQPCMWSGGAQAMKVSVTDPIITDSSNTWDVNSSMRLPLPLCSPYGGDFDGDEMTLFVVKSKEAIKECTSFSWPYDNTSPYRQRNNDLVVANAMHNRSDIVNYQAMCTTTCWSDRVRGTKITRCHEDWLCKKTAFISFSDKHDNVESFMDACMRLTMSSFSKSSHQSDVGAIARRSKLGSERLTLNADRIPTLKFLGRPCRHLVALKTFPSIELGWFGNPCVRAVSKLCASIMQITLKVKSSSSVEMLSPTLSLLEGSESWLVLMKNGSVSLRKTPLLHNYHEVECSCSLMDISHAPIQEHSRLVASFLRMVLVECNKSLDSAEVWCLETLMNSMCIEPSNQPMALQMQTHVLYPEFNTLQRFNGCFVTQSNICNIEYQSVPSSTIEAMLLGKFDDFPSIHPV